MASWVHLPGCAMSAPNQTNVRLRRVGICVPNSVIARAGELAALLQISRNAVLKDALERGLLLLDVPAVKGPTDNKSADRRRSPETLEQVRFRIGKEHKRRIEAFAARKGHRDASSAIAELVTGALDDDELGDNVPASRADEIEQAIRELRDLLGEIGPGVLGIIGLLSHWATQSGGLEVEEDELVEEALAEGRQAWALRQEMAASGDPAAAHAAEGGA